jgi:hypothetical protein
MSRLRFRAVIEINNINPYVLVSARRAVQIRKGWRKPLPVHVRVNGKPEKPWRINLMPVGDGSFYLFICTAMSARRRRTKVGDAVTVELEFDAAYKSGPAHPLPAWFKAALDKNQKAKQAWSQLIPSRQKEILRYFSWLKSRKAQMRNCERAIQVLSGGKARFMGKSWND